MTTTDNRALPVIPKDAVPEWLSYPQAAEAFPALGRRYIKRLVVERRIPVYKPTGPHGRTLLKRSDIEAFIESGRLNAIGAA